MSKERLEEMPYHVGFDRTGKYARLIADDYDFLYQYALEQSERAQELEEKHKEYISFVESNNHSMDADLEKLYKQNKRYREALEFYAVSGQGIGEEKHGEVARKALEGEE